MDQPQSLGARRPQFSSGSAGGGQQTERNAAARSMIGVRGAGRGSLASRDNSQPSSREPSESRRQSSNDERVAVSFESIPFLTTSTVSICMVILVLV